MKICLAPQIEVIKSTTNDLFIIDEGVCYTLESTKNWEIDFITSLEEGIEFQLLLNHPNASEKLAILNNLYELGFLIEKPKEDWSGFSFQKQLGWLSRHSSKPEFLQKKLINSKVAIIGLGGIGSIVARHLSASGVVNFFLIDGDEVAMDNLNRQYLFSPNDVGFSKVDCVKKHLTNLNSASTIHVEKKFIESQTQLAILDDFKPDIILQCADRPIGKINEIVAQYCLDRKVAFLNAATGLSKGYWGPLIVPYESSCYKCIQEKVVQKLSENQKRVYKEIKVIQEYSFGPTNSIISSFCAMDAILCLIGKSQKAQSLGTKVYFDMENLDSSKMKNIPCNCW